INVLCISPYKTFCTIWVEHRDKMNSQVILKTVADGIKAVILTFQEIEDIKQCLRCRRLITVHLRPQHDLFITSTILKFINRTAFHRLTYLCNLQYFLCFMYFNQGHYILMLKTSVC